MACGTPVIAFPSGALADIVQHGRTGFLVCNAAEMADAIRKAGELSPDVCRSVARTQYSSERMIERYFQTYERIVSPECHREGYSPSPVESIFLTPPSVECSENTATTFASSKT
jgi:hypothetical protein